MAGMAAVPQWLGIAGAATFTVIACAHLRHMLRTGGQRRPWHGCHALIALGMASMYLPASTVPGGAWRVLFAVAGALAAVWALGASGRAPLTLWLLTAVDLGAMFAMFSPGTSAALAWTLTAYCAAGAVIWGFDVHRRIDGVAPVFRWQTLAAPAGAGPLPVAGPRAGAVRLLGELDISVSMAVMSLGMAVTFAAMQLRG